MKPHTKNFTLRLDPALAAQLDYIAAYYGRDRTHQIIWALRQHVEDFRRNVGEIDLDALTEKQSHPDGR